MRWTRAMPGACGWVRWWVVAVAAAAVIVAGCGSASGSPRLAPQGPSRAGVPVPGVDEAAFAGHGELAFVSRGTLWVLNGATGTLRRVPTPGVTPLDPSFSRDGRWLSFLGTRASGSAQETTVWLASEDGSGAHQLVASGGLVGWSPAADVLAVTAGNAIRLIWPSGAARTLVRAPGIGSAVWSPDGSSLAVAVRATSATILASYPVTGGRPTAWLRLGAYGGTNYPIDLAGWWGHEGIGYWGLGDCASCNADGDPFYVITSPGAHPQLLGTTLADTGLDQVAAAPDGRLAIVAETPGPGMGGRLIWQDRTVKICGPVAACAAVPSPASTVTLDPAWSPGGAALALVHAPYRASPAFPQNVVAAWYDAHQLWLYDPARRSLRKLNASGATVPAWSADGRSLLYVAQDGIWLLPSLTGRPARIAGPLFPPGNWPTYYGQIQWLSQFAWWQD
jgi:dipeptidyl aminopeptidase/acylaminoacyl peptidase